LVEYANAEGTFLICPNNREALPKRRPRKGAKEEEVVAAATCSYDRKIGPPKAKVEPEERKRPDPDKTRPVVEAVA
jgi:DNA topoisomerase-1